MPSFANLCEVSTATTGTGTMTLGSAVAGYNGVSVLTNGATYNYTIRDTGNAYEVGYGVYSSSGTTLTRATIVSSSNSNTAINLSGSNAIVVVGQPLASDMPGAWPVLDVSYSGSSAIGASGFNTVPLNSVTTDTHGGMNTSTYIYTIPQAGTYDIAGKYRLQDGFTSGVSIGIGMDTSNADSPAFFWGVSNPNRNGIRNRRITAYASGAQIRLFGYIDGGSSPSIIAAAMQIVRIR